MSVNVLVVGPTDCLGADKIRQVRCVMQRDLASFLNDLDLLARREIVLGRSDEC